jgi:hypothetical protein
MIYSLSDLHSSVFYITRSFCPCQTVTAQGVRFKVLQQVKQLLMYRTPVSSPKALDQSTAGAAARWATRSAKLGGGRVYAPGVGAPVPCGQVLLEVGCGPVRVTGQDICRAKGHFALFGVLSGGVAGGRDVRRAKWHFALFGVPSGGVAGGRAVCRAKWHFALFGVPSVQAGRAVSKFIRPDGAYEKKTSG